MPRKPALGFIFVTLALDILGIGLIIPILPRLVESFQGGSVTAASHTYGVLAALYSLMQFLFAPVLGSLSDRFGRRPVILASLFGSGLDYFVLAFAPNLGWFFVGRVVAGVTGANFAAATAYIADVSPPEKRAANFGLIGAAFGLGFIAGPALGGLLGNVGLRVPFLVAGGLTLLNWLYGWLVLPESLAPQNRRAFSWARSNPVGSLLDLRRHPMAFGLAGTYFLIYLAHQVLPSTWVLYTGYRYHWTVGQTGLSLAIVGLMAVIVQGGLTRLIVTRLGEEKTATLGLAIGALSYAGYGLATEGWMIYAILVLGSLGGITGPAVQGLISRGVGANEQGGVQGSLSSLTSVAGILGPPIAAGLFAHFIGRTTAVQVPGAAFFFSAALMVVAMGLALRSFQEKESKLNCASVIPAVVVTLLLLNLPLWAKPKMEAERESPIIFSPAGGVYTTNISLQLSARAGSLTIRYTLDGSEPDEASPAYSAPLVLTNTTLVRARAFPKLGPPVGSADAVYTMLSDDLLAFSSNLPLIIVNSFGTNIVHEKKIEATVQVIDGGTNRTKLLGGLGFSGCCRINIRGRASLRYPKNSFSVKTINGDGDAASVSILGMPAESDWVLYAPYPDKTLMRDALAYELHAQMGHWAARTRFVEVFVNRTGTKLGAGDYAGVYVFEERVKRAPDRVNIAKLKPDGDTPPRISGGYIFKKDHIDQGGGPVGGEGYGAGPTPQNTRLGYPTGPGSFPADPKGFLPAARVTRTYGSGSSRSSRPARIVTNHLGFASTRLAPEANPDQAFRDEYDAIKEEESFRTTHTNEFYFVEPAHDEITPVQKAWLKRHLNESEAALYGPDFRDPAKGYAAYIDPDSFIDYHLITETTKNVDGYRFSAFYHKDRGGKIKADPIWDWNLSFGNANAKQGWMPEYWLWPQLDDRECTWYRRLFDDPDFGQRYVDRWWQLRTNVLATKRILARVDEWAALLQESQQRNYEKWPILGRAINPNYFVGSSFDEEVTWMKKFIETRLDWMEKQFLPIPKISIKSDRGARSVAISTNAGEIYFTLDGTDPRVSGGGLSKDARLYQTPLELKAGAKLFARVRQENRWSGPLVWKESTVQ